MGLGINRPMLVTLSAPAKKGKVYKCMKNLKGITNEQNEHYQIQDHLPAQMNEIQTRQNKLKKENKKRTVDQLEMNLIKGSLMIQGNPYKKLIEVPTEQTLLKSTPEQREKWMKIKTVPGNVIKKEKC